MKINQIWKRLLALVLVTALCVQTVSTRFFDTAYAADSLSAEAENLQTTEDTETVGTASEVPVTVLGEMESLRTEGGKHFRMSDGTYMAVSYGMAVHVQDEDGNWQDIDNRMVLLADQTAYRTCNPESTTDFSVSLTGGSLFETSHDGTSVSMSLLDTAQANRIMAQYAAQLETQMEILAGAETATQAGTVPELQTGMGTETASQVQDTSLPTEDAALGADAQTELQSELQAKLRLVEEALSAGNTLLTYDRTAAADTSVAVPTMVNTGPAGNTGDSRAGWTMEDILPENLQSSILYEDVFPGVDLLYTKYSHHVKEQIIVNAPRSSYRYDFALTLDGVEAVLDGDGSVSLLDETGEVRYYIPAPFMQDADGVISHEVEYVLTPSADGVILSVIADADWMNDEERAYPVAVDPTVRVSEKTQSRTDMASGYVLEGLPDNAYGGADDLWIGWTQWNSLKESIAYFYIRTLPEIPAGSVVIDAGLQLYMLDYSQVSLNELAIGAYELTDDLPSTVSNYADWISGMTWNTRADYDTGNLLDYNIVSADTKGYDVRWEITELVKKWYREETQKRCIALAIDQDAAYSNTCCANATFYGWDSTDPPVLTVTYRDQTGIEPYYTYTAMGVGNAGAAYIADATGQLKAVKNAASYASAVNPFTLNLVYNSDYFVSDASADYQVPAQMGVGNITMKLGQGWTLDLIQTMKTETIDGEQYICYHDGDGTKHYFRVDETKNAADDEDITYYYDEDGLGLKVKITAGAGLADDQPKSFVMYDDQDNSWTFTAGRLAQTRDPNGNIYTVNYDSAGRITTIVQTNNGRTAITVAAFAYNGDYVSEITNAAGNVYCLAYSSGNLTGITVKETENSTAGTGLAAYEYQGNRLTEMTDVESGYAIVFGYSEGKISQYREYGGDTSGAAVSVTYVKDSMTKYRLPGTDNLLGNDDDLYSCYLFDHAGRTVNAYSTDIDGVILGAANAAYTGTGSTDKKNNRITQTSSIGKTARQLMQNGGMEYTSIPWAPHGGGEVISDASKARTGSYVFRGTISDTAAYADNHILSAPLTAGKTYTFSAYVNTSGLTDFTGTGVYVQVVSGSDVWYSNRIDYATDTEVGGGWIRISVTFTAKTDGAHTLCICGNGAAGTFYADDAQLEENGAPSEVNLIENGSILLGNYGWVLGQNAAYDPGTGVTSSSIRIHGSVTAADASTAYQVVPIQLPGTETYVLSGWVKANAVPDNLETVTDSAQDRNKQCGLRAIVNYSDGSTPDYHYVPFDPDIEDWQFVSMPIVPKQTAKTVASIQVICAYEKNANTAYFDDLSLIREAAQTMTYDDDGNLKSVITTGLSGEINTYSGGNLIETETEGSGTYTYEYDETYKHRVISATNGVITQTMGYDTSGNVSTTTLKSSTGAAALTINTSASYDDNGNRLTSVTDPMNSTVRYEYGSGRNEMYGLPSSVTDPMGVKTGMEYDLLGRTTSAAIEGTAGVTYTYSSGNLTQIVRTNGSNAAQTYHLAYDAFGGLTGISVGSRDLASYTYGANNGYLTGMTYGNGVSVSYTYDRLGRVIKETYSDGRTVDMVYNGDGRLSMVIDSVSGTTCYDYDSLGRLISMEKRSAPGSLSISQMYVSQDYDENNRLSFHSITYPGDETFTGSYTYNNTTGAMSGMTVGNEPVTFTYDSLLRLSAMTGGISSRAYTYLNPTSTTTTMQVTKVQYPEMGTDFDFEYTYDARGNIASYTTPSGSVTTYTYDDQGQLVQAGSGYSYTYDGAGNLLTATVGGVNHTYTYGNAEWRDLLTAYDGESITYDASGNPLSYYNGTRWTFAWENGRRLKTAGDGTNTVSYTYDADGQRVTKTVNGVVHTYYYAGGLLRRETYGDTTLDFFYDANGVPYSMLQNGNTMYYYITNLEGDVIRLVDCYGNTAAMYKYDPYGGEIYATGSHAEINPLRYRGYYYDVETGFYYLQSRYYDPEIGRFINADSLVSTGQNIIGYNMFAYCLNDPVNRIDVGGAISFKKEDEINDVDKHFNDVTGGGGYYYCVDLSMAARSPIMSGGVQNYGYVHYGYSAPVYGNGGGNANSVGGISGSTELTTYYPPNNGAVSGTTKYVYLQPGTAIDRYGRLGGNYFSPTGTPLEMRALSPNTDLSMYSSFVVTKPFVVEMGTIAPAFGHIGLGVQYYSLMSAKTLLEYKFICYAE